MASLSTSRRCWEGVKHEQCDSQCGRVRFPALPCAHPWLFIAPMCVLIERRTHSASASVRSPASFKVYRSMDERKMSVLTPSNASFAMSPSVVSLREASS